MFDRLFKHSQLDAYSDTITWNLSEGVAKISFLQLYAKRGASLYFVH